MFYVCLKCFPILRWSITRTLLPSPSLFGNPFFWDQVLSILILRVPSSHFLWHAGDWSGSSLIRRRRKVHSCYAILMRDVMFVFCVEVLRGKQSKRERESGAPTPWKGRGCGHPPLVRWSGWLAPSHAWLPVCMLA